MNTSERELKGPWRLGWLDGQRGSYAEPETVDLVRPERWLRAEVPGEVHLDLEREGILPDVRIGNNARDARWVEETLWLYDTEFEVASEEIGRTAWIRFDGLAYNASVWVNGVKIGSHANYHRPAVFDVSNVVVAGENRLTVELESGLYAATEQGVSGLYGNSRDAALHKRNLLRIPQSTTGWDWAPRLLNVGIHGRVFLGFGSIRVHQVSVVPSTQSDGTATTASLRVTAVLSNLASEPQNVRIEVTSQELEAKARVGASIDTGEGHLRAELTDLKPEPWWPVGHGAQRLYPIEVRVESDEGVLWAGTVETGFRQIDVDQSTHPDSGRYFRLLVNGRPIFAKGANFVPADLLPPRVDRETYDLLVSRAVEANMNMLRVWGGGIYEREEFYAACDREGIMVWQDFAFACGSYPMNDLDFHQNATAEAHYQVRRLSTHPSLVMYCGNNENSWHTRDKEFPVMEPDHALYHEYLPRIIASLDPSKYYQPSSPFSPDWEHPNADDVGDQHPWTVGAHHNDIYAFRDMSCRFPNEGGALGINSLATVRAALNGAEDRAKEGESFLDSLEWMGHDCGAERFWLHLRIDSIFEEWFGLDPRSLTLEEIVYWCGLYHGEGLKEYAENFRGRAWDSAGALFWMFNDCWPTSRSWTVVDYYGRRTPAFYSVRRSFAPVHVVLREVGQTIRVVGVNDSPVEWSGRLRFGSFLLSGDYADDEHVDCLLPPGTATVVGEFEIGEWDEATRRRRVPFAQLLSENGESARTRLFLERFKELELEPARLDATIENGRLLLRSDVFVWGVNVDLNGETAEDNAFDIFPGETRALPWPDDKPIPRIWCGNMLAGGTGG